MEQAAKRRNAPARRRRGNAATRDRLFWIALSVAAILHVALIVGAVRSAPRIMGEQDGDPDAVSVDIVDAESLISTPGPQRENGESAPPPAPPPQPAAEAKPKEAEAKPKEAESPFQFDPEAVAMFPPREREEGAAKGGQQHARASPQLTPPGALDFGAGRSATVGRPPNITRSGENDEFGRGVVRALRRTMPTARSAARVTIRFVLSESGNLAEITLVRSSGDPVLDQNVVFSAKQASFPLPPAGATTFDRIFLVTYIYHDGLTIPQ
jgi:protein TonB